MALPCIYTFNGNEYDYATFAAMLHDGLLDSLVKDGVVRELPPMEQPVLSEIEQAKADFQAAKEAFRRASGQAQFGGMGALPEFINLIKTYLKVKGIELKEVIRNFRKDFPETFDISDEDIRKVYESLQKSMKDMPEDTAQEIEQTYAIAEGTIADKVNAAMKVLKKSDFYYELNNEGKAKAEDAIFEQLTKGQVTGIKRAVVDAERAAKGLDYIDTKGMSRADEEIFNEAHKLIDSGEINPRIEAKRIAENPKEAANISNPSEVQAALAIDRVKINNEIKTLTDKFEQAREDGNVKLENRIEAQISDLEQAADYNDRAVTYIGTKLSEAFKIRRRLIGEDMSLQRMRINFFRDNPGETTIPKDIQDRLKDFEKKVQDLNSELDKLQKEKEQSQWAATIQDIQESIDREKKQQTPEQTKKIKEATKKIADKLRSGTLHKGSIFSSGTPASIVFDLSIKAAAEVIEKGGTIAQAVADGIMAARKVLKESEWYKSLSKSKQIEADTELDNYIREAYKDDEQTDARELTLQGKVRELVKSGIKDIETITETIQREIYPEKTIREVRDMITNYGKQINAERPQLETDINRAKRIGVLLSKLEDAKKGLRPFRKIIGKDPPQDLERKYQRELNELLKTLPPEEADAYRKIKTAQDAKITRLRNRIKDLQSDIDTVKKGGIPEKRTRAAIPDTQEIKDLEAQRDELQKELDELYKKQDLTDAEYRDKWMKSAERRIKKYQEKIDNKDFATRKPRQVVHDTKSAEVLGKLEAIKKQYKAFREAQKQKEMSNMERGLRALSRLPRFTVLLSTKIFGKLFAFGQGALHMTPLEATLAHVWSKLPFLGRITKYAPMHGGTVKGRELINLYAEYTNPVKLWKDWKGIWKKGLTPDMEKYSEHLPQELANFWDRVDNAMEAPGRSHMMLKAPILRAKQRFYYERLMKEYDKAYKENMQEAIARGEDPANPQFILLQQGKAFAQAYNDILLGKNIASTMWTNLVKSPIKTAISGTKAASKAKELGIQSQVKITTVPLNYINSVFEWSGGGLGKAAWNYYWGKHTAAKEHDISTFKEIFQHGMDRLSKEDQEVIAKNFVRGTIGVGLLAYGWANADQIGGYPIPGEKKREGDVQPFEEKWFGYKVPHIITYTLHLPQVEAIRVGATLKHAVDFYTKKGKSKSTGIAAGALAVGKQQLKSAPMMEEVNRVHDATSSLQGFDKYIGESLKSATIPTDLQKMLLPIKEKPEGILDVYTTRRPMREEKSSHANPSSSFQKGLPKSEGFKKGL